MGRMSVLFNEDWKFRYGDDFSGLMEDFRTEEWKAVTLPHDWDTEFPVGEKNHSGGGGGYAQTGIGWYAKQFSIPKAMQGMHLRLRFEGVFMNSTVLVNGNPVGGHIYGYTEFSLPLESLSRDTANFIAVRVDNSMQPNSRWYTGSGIYRDVRLDAFEDIHIAEYGVFCATADLYHDNRLARMQITTQVENNTRHMRTVTVTHQFFDMLGEVVCSDAAALSVLPDGVGEAMVSPTIQEPKLWSDETPYLYTLETTLRDLDGRELDRISRRVGIRTAKFHCDQGFLLNGKQVKIKGMCLHHDGGLTGAAFYRDTWVRRLKLLKEMGCNGVRCAHNPPAPAFLELCDELGFLVMDEAFDEWQLTKFKSAQYGYTSNVAFGYSQYFEENGKRDLERMLLRDRNHPSIILWSIGNEIPEQTVPGGVETLLFLQDICHRLDPTRKVCSACDNIAAAAPFTARREFECALDVVGYNYVARWGKRAETLYDTDREAYPKRCMIGSENPSAGGLRGDYRTDNKQYRHHYTTVTLNNEYLWRYTASRDYVAGDYLWTGIDYLGESMWPLKGSLSGAIDTAGFPKDTYYYFRSIWNEQATTLHLLPHWNWAGREGEFIPVIAYTDCEEVTLYINGRKVGTKGYDCPNVGALTAWNVKAKDTHPTTHDLHLAWDVPYEAGELKAVGFKGGKAVAEAVIHTTKKAALLEAAVDRQQLHTGDLAHVEICARDEGGLFVPDADASVTVHLTGPARLIGMDNGNQGDLTPYTERERALLAGRLLCVIQATGEGTITVELTSKGMPPLQTTLLAVPQLLQPGGD